MPANPFQLSEYLVDHRRVFDAGDDADITAARADRHTGKASCSQARKPPCWLSLRWRIGSWGRISSTAYDYARFIQMLLNDGELDDVRMLGRRSAEHPLESEEEQGSQNTTNRQSHHPGHDDTADHAEIDGADTTRQAHTNHCANGDVRG